VGEDLFHPTILGNLGLPHQLSNHEVYFTSEIHSALANPWQNKQCFYADNKNDYQHFQVNGIYDLLSLYFALKKRIKS
jgi:hypothetical protein